jgi:DNA gyrase/topoisomerase IV subunit A
MLITKKAQMIKLPLKNIKQLGRNTQGIILMRFAKAGDYVAAMTCLKSTEDVDSGESETKKDKQENPLKTT